MLILCPNLSSQYLLWYLYVEHIKYVCTTLINPENSIIEPGDIRVFLVECAGALYLKKTSLSEVLSYMRVINKPFGEGICWKNQGAFFVSLEPVMKRREELSSVY